MNAAELKIIERIKKLQAMADSAQEVGSLAEAESFLEAVEKTLAKHNLDQSVLTLDTRNITDPLGSSFVYSTRARGANKPVRWAWTLGNVVARAHFCENLVNAKGGGIWLYGRKSNHTVAAKMFEYLRDMGEREGMKAWRKWRANTVKAFGGHVPGVDDIGWYHAWLEAFAVQIGERYSLMRARVESDKGTALVLVGVRQEAIDFAQKDIAPKMKDAPEPLAGGYHPIAHIMGKRTADEAELRPLSVEGAETPDTKRIG